MNIDGAGTRLGRMIHGPKHVVIIAGVNKISRDIQSAIDRIQNEVCPILAVKTGRNTACANMGRCGNCFTPGFHVLRDRDYQKIPAERQDEADSGGGRAGILK